jgi:hypothetical protein
MVIEEYKKDQKRLARDLGVAPSHYITRKNSQSHIT